jgi:acetyltransferase
VAVIGPALSPESPGHTIVSNLVRGGFAGQLYVMDPGAGQIEGVTVVRDSTELPELLELAIVCHEPDQVLPALEGLASRSVQSVIVTSSGFREIGGKGYYLEQEIKKFALKKHLTLLGPNCLGLINTKNRVNASFAASDPLPGNIAFFSPSGALCNAILDWAREEHIGFSKFVSLGNRAVVDEAEMLEYLSHDPDTRVIIGYLEGISNGQRFIRQAQDATRKKPVILLQAGMTSSGARAVSSHTGSSVGSEKAYQTAMKQAGVMRVESMDRLFDLAKAFSCQPLPRGSHLAIVTNSGGAGVMAADSCEGTSISLAHLGSKTLEALGGVLPGYAALTNPVDVGGDGDAGRYGDALLPVLKDPMVHGVLVVIAPSSGLDEQAVAEKLIQVAEKSKKPLYVCFVGQKQNRPGRTLLGEAGIPCYTFPREAVLSFEAMYSYYEWKRQPYPVEVCYRRDKPKAAKIIEDSRLVDKLELTGMDAQVLLQAYELPFPRAELARTSRSAVRIAKRIGLPVALKVASPSILYKSDVNGVLTDLEEPEQVRRGFLEVTSRAQRLRREAFISGCLVQSMAPRGGREVVIGFVRDPQFGPLLRLGLAREGRPSPSDSTYRLAPLSLTDAADMIREIPDLALGQGRSGKGRLNLRAVEDILLTVAQLGLDFPEVFSLELDPVIVGSEGVLVVGGRISLLPR